MKACQIISLILAVGFIANISAAPDPKPPPDPQDVNVVNTPSVTVTNPQTSVTVDNTDGNPVPVTVQNQSNGSPASQFVGFTTTTFDGGQGIITYTNACQQEYPGSWMCSSEEFINSKIYPASAGTAWIKPTYVPVGMGTGYSDAFVAVHDISGMVRSTNSNSTPGLSCVGWSSIGWENIHSFGLTVDETGKYGVSNCANVYKVACCSSAP
jgi:hypothetical protein